MWLNDNMEEIKNIPYPNDDELNKYYETYTFEVEPGKYVINFSIEFEKYDNIYDLLYNKIKDERTSINESGKMYKDFEEAISHYKEYKESIFYEINNNSEEINSFHSLMDFVYLGRKSKEEI